MPVLFAAEPIQNTPLPTYDVRTASKTTITNRHAGTGMVDVLFDNRLCTEANDGSNQSAWGDGLRR